jgi:flagellin
VVGTHITINGKIITLSDTEATSYNTTTGIGVIDISGMGTSLLVAVALTTYLNAHMDDIGVYAAQGIDEDGATDSIVHLIAHDFGIEGNEIKTSSDMDAVKAEQDALEGGGRKMVTASAYYNADTKEYELQLQMNHGGEKYQVQTFALSATGETTDVLGGIITNATFGTYSEGKWMSNLLTGDGSSALDTFSGVDDQDEWLQPQNGTGTTDWDGADVLTQSNAQKALNALDTAINKKDIIRASLGAVQNRLENSITNLQIQAENLQAAESRISDVDVATEMTEFTRNNILAQAATAMLAQANALPQLALQLIDN